ncbi:MAG TPA: ABC transporter substrate-binding protein [Acidisphaera sp.]|nr:ABC transporter substrate-binding protein [Acidisphaera sp.]
MIPIRLGIVRLVDSAPAVVGDAEGLFAAEGLDVTLHVEPSWANIADKLAWSALDAAIIVAPLALAMSLGLREPKRRLPVPMGISRGGNSIVVGPAVDIDTQTTDATQAAQAFAAWLRGQRTPPRFAVVHVFSTHNLLLRHWLAAAGVDPDRDLEIVVVPPERVVDALDAGRIAGFCAGAPWGERAAELGAGRVLLGTSSIRPDHLEKVLALAPDWRAANRDAAAALCRALASAQAACARADRADAVAALLAQRLDLPVAAARRALPGGAAREHVRFAAAGPVPQDEIAWLLGEMRRWSWIRDHEPPPDPATPVEDTF